MIAVFAGSPASKAGLREGDVVVSIDGRPVRSTEEISKALSALDPGDSVVLDVVDRSGPRRVTVTVGQAAGDGAGRLTPSSASSSLSSRRAVCRVLDVRRLTATACRKPRRDHRRPGVETNRARG